MGFISNLFNNLTKPKIDIDEIVEYIADKTSIDEDIIATVLLVEEDFLKEKGIAY